MTVRRILSAIQHRILMAFANVSSVTTTRKTGGVGTGTMGYIPSTDRRYSCGLMLAGCTTSGIDETSATCIVPEAKDVSEGDLVAGKAQFREANYGLAEKHFRKAVELRADDSEAWMGLPRRTSSAASTSPTVPTTSCSRSPAAGWRSSTTWAIRSSARQQEEGAPASRPGQERHGRSGRRRGRTSRCSTRPPASTRTARAPSTCPEGSVRTRPTTPAEGAELLRSSAISSGAKSSLTARASTSRRPWHASTPPNRISGDPLLSVGAFACTSGYLIDEADRSDESLPKQQPMVRA